ncbi:MFS general substrate transporter [Aspergillus saccharolyticus JOP 1030-1]|uniref:MFS general substrate transporter n=1 Tax=Aspergillus saccharolyticus JOP 1030-1 TaxID=1450539 RepID=A0A318Z7B0_9EURO|nr:MFS general substrate transporter [Aspergillus saccharolyticus JOP 1030-1]PYH42287.1 MFS general substrate transporter [Aspergillus saccharolyticus JOP 1030-1]
MVNIIKARDDTRQGIFRIANTVSLELSIQYSVTILSPSVWHETPDSTMFNNHQEALPPDTSGSDVKGEYNTSAHLEYVPASQLGQANFLDAESPANPQTWPVWKKNAQILMVAFHSMVATFMAAGIIPAYDAMAEAYGVTVPQASYLTSMQILLLGICPLFWKPLTAVYGRYHIFMLSALGSMVCNIGGARCTTYGAQMATRVLTAIFISPPMGVGSGIITELCEPEQRAQKLGWWTLMLTLGTPGGPFIMGFVTHHLGYQWMYWIFAIMNLVQLLAYLILGEETLYLPAPEPPSPSLNTTNPPRFYHKLRPRRINPHPLTLQAFFTPLLFLRRPRVLIPALTHAIVFCYANIALIVEMPIVFGERFAFNSQQIGLQFIAIIIGCLLGEQLSGPLSDKLLRAHGTHRPADRLWLAYIAFGTVVTGLLVWGFQLSKATTWNVTPCVGAAIASFGNQALTTIMVSYAVDSHREVATDVGVCINVVRHVYGFIGPFYFPPMFETLGLAGAAGVMCAIVGGCALPAVVGLHIVDVRGGR